MYQITKYNQKYMLSSYTSLLIYLDSEPRVSLWNLEIFIAQMNEII